ncbi:SOS response-associated peptidase [Gillisia marina]|uniref:SOS response-associated peptidase n=1 Tax=Gillisia marina TaxID=1167637 RepID=UPI000299EBEE|nr:SOS response-associated peptidase [Gillisia marina]
MCVDIKATLEGQLKRARQKNNTRTVEEIIDNLIPFTDLPIYHASGYSHPELLIYTDRYPNLPEVATWGLVPQWVEDEKQLKKQWNNTLNARGESIFTKVSFSESAKSKRCLIYVDGFYEHHHYNGKTYPFLIYRKDHEPFALAGLWSEWQNPDTRGTMNTFTIVTTSGNSMMAKIHNNPKSKEPRMPVILPSELEDYWLNPINDELDKLKIEELIKEFPEENLTAHTVNRLRGKQYLGNVENISDKFVYEELIF